MKILCIGPQFRGSNAAAMFKALSKLGHYVNVVDEFYHIPLTNQTTLSKYLGKLFRLIFIKSFNKTIHREFKLFQPDVVLVYKGAFVYPEIVKQMQQKAKVVCFYPDVSFHTHGNFLHKTLPLYEKVFTTKTFGINDMKEQLGQENGVFIPHGFDPDIHRILDIPEHIRKQFACDASFIGTWSPHKEEYLSYLVQELPHLKLKIWGEQWNKAGKILAPYVQGAAVMGDLYAIAIQCSKINVALMSEQVKGASSGDLITSRTFHIPAAGGFMLHQDSSEIRNYYSENEEIVLFSTKDDLFKLIKKYLSLDEERNRIAENGHIKALKEHSINTRAIQVIATIESID